MNSTYIATTVIVVEFGLVVIIIIFTYFLKLYYYFKDKNTARLKIEMYNYVTNLINSDKHFNAHSFPNTFKRLDLILPLVHRVHEENRENSKWSVVKKDFIQTIILPLARKEAVNKNWLHRLYATKAFQLDKLKQADPDKEIINKLIDDLIPLVTLNALQVALQSGYVDAINRIITKLAKERDITQTIYLMEFERAPIETQFIVAERLVREKEPYTRAACYDILTKYPPRITDIDPRPDIESHNIELKTSAMRYLARVEKEKSIPCLIDLLNSKFWAVRVVAIQCLRVFKNQEVYNALEKCLKDNNWWVRLNAAQALMFLGDEGIKILKNQEKANDKYAYEMAQHILAIK